jgi:hypothetical protein
MGYRRLFIWVEGEDDARFFEKIMEPRLKKKYDFVETRRYAAMKKEKIDNFLKSIKAMGAEYIFVVDINNSPCVTAKKQGVQNRLRNIDVDRIIVAIKEIEGWYLAGLGNIEAGKFKIRTFDNTDTITKEKFNSLIPKQFDSRVDFMLEILKNFSIEIAKQKNESFRYVIENYNCETYGNDGNSR